MNGVQLIQLPKIRDVRGHLTFCESMVHIPFRIKRVYWIFDIPGRALRNGHAFKTTEEIIVPLSGSFEISVNNGLESKSYILSQPNQALLVKPLVWRELTNFSTNAIVLVMCSKTYNDEDYIRGDENLFKSKLWK